MPSTRFYLRSAAGEEVLGPYTLSELKSLAENGNLTPDHELLAEEDADQPNTDWQSFHALPAVQEEVFPKKRKLAVRKPTSKTPLVPAGDPGAVPPPGTDPSESEEIEERSGTDVREILAAAQGKTADTRRARSNQRARELAALLILPGLLIMLALSTFTFAFPQYEWIVEQFLLGEYTQLLTKPTAVVALVDLVMLFLLTLAATSIFPFLRFRMMAGLGFFGYFAYSFDEWIIVAALAAGSIGAFGVTTTLNLKGVIPCLIAGIGGFGFLAWQSWQGNLPF